MRATRSRAGDEERLGEFSALVAQAIVNAEARRETEALSAEQSSLRAIATLVAGGSPQAEVLDAVTAEAGSVRGGARDARPLGRRPGRGGRRRRLERAGEHAGRAPVAASTRIRAARRSACSRRASRSRGRDLAGAREQCSVIAAPVIVNAALVGALTASRAAEEPFPPARRSGCAASPTSRRSRSRTSARRRSCVRRARASSRTADEARRRLERNLHDGAQQRLVSVSVVLRLAARSCRSTPDECAHADRRRIRGADAGARGVARPRARPASGGADGAGARRRRSRRSPAARRCRSTCGTSVERRLPAPVEAAVYYVVVGVADERREVRAGLARSDVRVTSATASCGRGRRRRRRRRRHRRRLGPARPRRSNRDGGRALRRREPPGEGTCIWAEVDSRRALVAERLLGGTQEVGRPFAVRVWRVRRPSSPPRPRRCRSRRTRVPLTRS